MVVLDAPETLNAITRETLVALAAAFRALGEDASVRAVVVTGAGRRAFTTGIDLGDAHRVFKMDPTDLANDVVHQMELLGSRRGVPVVGAVNGVAVNAGFEIALACDVLLCSPSAAFVDTHAKLGLLPSWGLSQKLPRIVGANVARMTSLTAAPLTATDARRWPRQRHRARSARRARHARRRRGSSRHDGGGVAGGAVAGGADAGGADAGCRTRARRRDRWARSRRTSGDGGKPRRRRADVAARSRRHPARGWRGTSA